MVGILRERYTREEGGTTKEGEKVSTQYYLGLLKKHTQEGKEDIVGLRTLPWAIGLAFGGFPIVGNAIPTQTNKLGV